VDVFIAQPQLHSRCKGASRRQINTQRQILAQAQTNTGGGIGGALKNFARQVQSALPIVGLISRLAATSGGIGNDEIAYPEFARLILNEADPEFKTATDTWAEQYQQVGQRKYVLLYLWMARTGLGLVPTKMIATSALRLRVTQDIEIEVERFEYERDKALKVYSYAQRPKGKTREQVDIAVDSLARVSIGLKDGEPISQRDQQLVIPIVAQAFFDVEGALEMTKSSVTDAARAERKTRNA